MSTTSFFEQQATHRFAARLWACACATLALATAAGAGAGLGSVIWLSFRAIATAHQSDWPVTPAWWILALPGTILTLGVWLRLRRSLIRHGADGLTLTLGTRSIRDTDPEEQQLRNIAEETAIAAGVLPPEVLILDGGPANAAVIGEGPNGTVVVSRALLTLLDRDQTQAILAHAQAIIANGDPKLSLEAFAVIQTFGLLAATCEAPLNRFMRRAVWQTLRSIVSRRQAPGLDDRIRTQLLGAIDLDSIDESGSFVERSSLWSPLLILRLPIFGVVLLAKAGILLATLFVAGPFLWSLFRTRRYLADATAVQLTRSSALSSALQRLDRDGGIDHAHDWATPFFVVAPLVPETRSSRLPIILFGVQPPVSARVQRLATVGGQQ